MKTTPKQRKAVAAEIRAYAVASPEEPRYHPAHGGFHRRDTDITVKLGGATFRLRNHPDALEAAARRIEAGHGGFIPNEWVDRNAKPDIMEMDAVRHCGTPAAALETIRRQLAIQRDDMHPPDVKRCERAASLIEAHIAAEIREAELQAAEDALEARIAAGRVPDNLEILAPGTEVCVARNHRRYIGTVSGSKIAPHPILGKAHPVAVTEIRADRLKETKGKRYAFPSVKPLTIKKAIWTEITIL